MPLLCGFLSLGEGPSSFYPFHSEEGQGEGEAKNGRIFGEHR
jgi:hypothetical protein